MPRPRIVNYKDTPEYQKYIGGTKDKHGDVVRWAKSPEFEMTEVSIY